MSNQGRPNSQYNTAKRETEEAEEFDRFMSGEDLEVNEEDEELHLGGDNFDRLEDIESEDY